MIWRVTTDKGEGDITGNINVGMGEDPEKRLNLAQFGLKLTKLALVYASTDTATRRDLGVYTAILLAIYRIADTMYSVNTLCTAILLAILFLSSVLDIE